MIQQMHLKFNILLTAIRICDYRLINDNATFKLQYENADFPYGDNKKIITWKSITCKNHSGGNAPIIINMPGAKGMLLDALITHGRQWGQPQKSA
jgi:hypothetical protein